MVQPEGPQIAVWRRIACWISKATRAQAHDRARTPTQTLAHARHAQKYVILIAFPGQQ